MLFPRADGVRAPRRALGFKGGKTPNNLSSFLAFLGPLHLLVPGGTSKGGEAVRKMTDALPALSAQSSQFGEVFKGLCFFAQTLWKCLTGDGSNKG